MFNPLEDWSTTNSMFVERFTRNNSEAGAAGGIVTYGYAVGFPTNSTTSSVGSNDSVMLADVSVTFAVVAVMI